MHNTTEDSNNKKTINVAVTVFAIISMLININLIFPILGKFNNKISRRKKVNDVELGNGKVKENNKKAAAQKDYTYSDDETLSCICRGLGGAKNIIQVDCCVTRLRCKVFNPELVNDELLRFTKPIGIIHKNKLIQIVYGPKAVAIVMAFKRYLKGINESVSHSGDAQNPDKYNIVRPDREIMQTEKTGLKKVMQTFILASPFTGTASGIDTAPDYCFAEKMMGDGVVVEPCDGIVVAPDNGVISFVFPTKHAIGFITDDGHEVLIHTGIDTYNLKGEGFELYVREGDRVKMGDKLMKLNIEYLRSRVSSLASPVVCPELAENEKIRQLANGHVKAKDPLFAIDVYEQ